MTIVLPIFPCGSATGGHGSEHLLPFYLQKQKQVGKVG